MAWPPSPAPSPPREMRDITARGLRLRVLEAGDHRDPPILLLHGYLTDHRSFDDVVERLATTYHVIAPDLPGFGESQKPTPGRFSYAIDAYAEVSADLFAAFGVGPAHVVGHSLGGAVALRMAASHRELVRDLVLVDAVCYPVPRPFELRLPRFPLVGGLLFKQLYGRSLFRSYFRERYFKEGAPLPLARIDAYYDAFKSPSGRESALTVLETARDTRPIVALLSRIMTPTLIMWGRDDHVLPTAHALRLAREIRDANLEILETGHAPHEEQPELFVELVTEFFEGRR